MITFTPDGKKVLTANEGEPSDDYSTDPGFRHHCGSDRKGMKCHFCHRGIYGIRDRAR
ncbi:MAG: hypothetical protein R2941_11745 [Desulfobacterales bacterium]